MKHEIVTHSTFEVVEQLEEEQIDLKVVRWVAGEGEPPACAWRIDSQAAAGSL